MKTFTPPSYRLSTASPHLRLVLSLYLVFTLLGLASNVVETWRQTQFSPREIATYYRGAGEQAGETLAYPKSAGELLLNSHFHLFMMSITLLVLCHIFYMTASPDWLKKGITWSVFLAALVEIGGPWLIRFVSSDFAFLMVLSGSILGLGMLVLIALPLYEMWGKAHESSPPEGP
jgi:hypothetical protein